MYAIYIYIYTYIYIYIHKEVSLAASAGYPAGLFIEVADAYEDRTAIFHTKNCQTKNL